MKEILKEYLLLHEQYVNKDTLTKEESKQKHIAFTKWKKSQYEETVTFEEVLDFLKEYNTYCFSKSFFTTMEKMEFIKKNPPFSFSGPFFDKMVVPFLIEGAKNADYTTLKLFLETYPDDIMDIHASSNIDNCLMNVAKALPKLKYSPVLLLKNAYAQYPESSALMQTLLNWLIQGFSYAVHELPIGILDFEYEQDMQDLKLMRTLIKNIGKAIDEETENHLQFLETIYPAYENYLTNPECCEDFEEYLNKHNIAYYDENGYIL